MANAQLDASIAAWNAKRRWDYVRPITAVHVRKQGQWVLAWAGPYKGTRLIKGETWTPYQAVTFPTPPFPEYVSGHSTFSGAGTKVLQQFTGSDLFGARVTIRPGTSFVEPGLTPLLPQVLLWPTFSAARDEAGMSRRYGGIHFPDADLDGRALGASVGQLAWAKAQTYWGGTAGG
jgi:membrane-associated phospholipid phosphatase